MLLTITCRGKHLGLPGESAARLGSMDLIMADMMVPLASLPASPPPPPSGKSTWASLLKPAPPPPVRVAPPSAPSALAGIERYDYECSPAYFKAHVPMSASARNWVNEIERLYWNKQDLSNIDRWLLRNLLPSVIPHWQEKEDRIAGVVPGSEGRTEIMKRCHKEMPFAKKWIANKMNRIYS